MRLFAIKKTLNIIAKSINNNKNLNLQIHFWYLTYILRATQSFAIMLRNNCTSMCLNDKLAMPTRRMRKPQQQQNLLIYIFHFE